MHREYEIMRIILNAKPFRFRLPPRELLRVSCTWLSTHQRINSSCITPNRRRNDIIPDKSSICKSCRNGRFISPASNDLTTTSSIFIIDYLVHPTACAPTNPRRQTIAPTQETLCLYTASHSYRWQRIPPAYHEPCSSLQIYQRHSQHAAMESLKYEAEEC
jgi:hypothetical protein